MGGVHSLSYKLYVFDKIQMQVIEFISQYKNKRIVCLNAFAGTERRSFSVSQVESITKYLSLYKDVVVILIGSQDQMKKLSLIQQSNVFLTPSNLSSLSHAVALIKFASLVITPDTSIVHIANAFNKRMVCLYNNRKLDDGSENNIVCGPNYSNCVQLFTKDNLGTTDGDLVSNYDVTEMFPYIKNYLE